MNYALWQVPVSVRQLVYPCSDRWGNKLLLLKELLTRPDVQVTRAIVFVHLKVIPPRVIRVIRAIRAIRSPVLVYLKVTHTHFMITLDNPGYIYIYTYVFEGSCGPVIVVPQSKRHPVRFYTRWATILITIIATLITILIIATLVMWARGKLNVCYSYVMCMYICIYIRWSVFSSASHCVESVQKRRAKGAMCHKHPSTRHWCPWAVARHQLWCNSHFSNPNNPNNNPW